nr:MAG TPA: hypothetical protein [Caudoviricetes sp.]
MFKVAASGAALDCIRRHCEPLPHHLAHSPQRKEHCMVLPLHPKIYLV